MHYLKIDTRFIDMHYLKIDTRFIERFASVMGECVIFKVSRNDINLDMLI